MGLAGPQNGDLLLRAAGAAGAHDYVVCSTITQDVRVYVQAKQNAGMMYITAAPSWDGGRANTGTGFVPD